MGIRRLTSSVVVAVLAVAATAVAAYAAQAPHTSVVGGKGQMARFEGRSIDLGRGWGAARACLIHPGRPVECFRTEAALEARVARIHAPDLSCSTPLKLYDQTSFMGTTVSIYSRGLWINLSTLSFDNRTSSFKVGACAVELASASSGGGSHYTRCLFAGCDEGVMLPGWSNVVSSVFLY